MLFSDFFKIIFFRKLSGIPLECTSNSLGQHQANSFVRLDLGSHCLEIISADKIIRLKDIDCNI